MLINTWAITLSLSKQNCDNQDNKMTEGNTPPPTITWTRGFCDLPSPLGPHWMMASCLSPSPLVWRKMFFVVSSTKVPVAWARRDMGWVRARVAPRVHPFVQRSRAAPSALQLICKVEGCILALLPSLLPPPDLKSLPILTNLDEFAMRTRDSLKWCPVASLPSFFLCQMSLTLQEKNIRTYLCNDCQNPKNIFLIFLI